METGARPRPSFATFLRSDENAGGDGLSWYGHQRLLREKKVSLLQKKRSQATVPGYKKPDVRGASLSRQVYQLPRARVREAGASLRICGAEAPDQQNQQAPPPTDSTSSVARGAGRERLVKSAHVRSVSWPVQPVRLLARPRTAGSGSQESGAGTTVSEAVQTTSGTVEDVEMDEGEQPHYEEVRREPLPCSGQPSHPQICLQGGPSPEPTNAKTALDRPITKDALANAFFWSTSTQKGYDEVDWAERLPPHLAPPPSTLEVMADPVSQKLTFRRYNSAPAAWQCFGSEWDYVQKRISAYFSKAPHSINYCSSSKSRRQAPGYTGCIEETEEADNPLSRFNAKLLVRSLKPRPTMTARRATIPGYTGHTHWMQRGPVHEATPPPPPSTTARVHRHLPLEEDHSPFARTGLLSRMVTTVSPYNPYNHIEH